MLVLCLLLVLLLLPHVISGSPASGTRTRTRHLGQQKNFKRYLQVRAAPGPAPESSPLLLLLRLLLWLRLRLRQLHPQQQSCMPVEQPSCKRSYASCRGHCHKPAKV
jgi:hypothetical protein